MIEPTASLPLHFSTETVVLAAAGLLVAWAVIYRRWPVAIAAALLAMVEGAHAGQFLEHENDPLLYVVRLVSVAVIALVVLRSQERKRLLGAGLAALFAGSVWGASAGGGAEDLQLGLHLLMFGGAILLVAWVWTTTRPSVRLRVLAAFISVLAVAVVVAGGAVARVAAVDARNDRFSTLGLEASTIVREVVTTRDVSRRRAATLSPVVAIGLAAGTPQLDQSRVLAGEWVVVLDTKAKNRASIAASGIVAPKGGDFSGLGVVRRALKAEVASTNAVVAGALQVVAAAPVYKPGSTQRLEDVNGAIVVGQTLRATALRDLTGDPLVDVSLVGPSDEDSTDSDLVIDAQAAGAPRGDVGFDTIGGSQGRERWLASFVRLPDGDAYLVVATPDDIVVDAATDLVRAFLIAILAAALLAVVAALWISARITRPMLQLADDAERVKTDFLASVSHELRTPLTPIRGYTEILRSRDVPARAASGYLDEIGMAAQRLERIVALLVDVAAIEAGRFGVTPVAVPAGDLVDATVARWIERSPRPIVVKTPQSLPVVEADPSAIARVLDELVDNGMKFAPDGEVELRARRTGDTVEFSVRDDGPGIDPERLAAVREAFRQADSSDTRRFGGLGLGLTFVEGVLDAHGAQLSIASTAETGTTCTFALPVAGKVGSMTRTASGRKLVR